jgi:hypothetical protein
MGEKERRLALAAGTGKLQGEVMAEMILSDQARAQKCLAEIQEVLKKHDCYANPVFIFDSNGGRGELHIKTNQRLIKP